MHKNLEEIKKLEGSPKIIKDLFSNNELEKKINCSNRDSAALGIEVAMIL